MCKRYVHGTESGHCPSCGFVPPSALDVVEPTGTWSTLAVVIAVTLIGFTFVVLLLW